jgi:hypothetical protein
MLSAPAAFDGPFSDFFERYVLPNLPPVDRGRAFDLRLRRCLVGADPLYVLRVLSGLERGDLPGRQRSSDAADR